MVRITIGFLVGTLTAAVGLILVLGAHSLATHWTGSAGGTRVGYTNPETVETYRLLGLIFLGFGLLLDALAFHRWLAASPPDPSGIDPPLA